MSPGLRGTSAPGSVPATAAPISTVARLSEIRLPPAHLIAGEIGAFDDGVALEAAGHAHQLRGSHAIGHGIIAGPQHLAANGDCWSVASIATEDANRVERLEVEIGVADEHVGNIEVDCFRVQVGRHEANDFTA